MIYCYDTSQYFCGLSKADRVNFVPDSVMGTKFTLHLRVWYSTHSMGYFQAEVAIIFKLPFLCLKLMRFFLNNKNSKRIKLSGKQNYYKGASYIKKLRYIYIIHVLYFDTPRYPLWKVCDMTQVAKVDARLTCHNGENLDNQSLAQPSQGSQIGSN